MRTAFAHDAVLLLAPDGDSRAPGAAITRALCGNWEHPPPCPFAPHFTGVTRVDATLHLRVLFAAAPPMEEAVRAHIDHALRAGGLHDPDGAWTTGWELCSSTPAPVTDGERDHAQRLVES